MGNPVKKVALAGASGFVGTTLRQTLGSKYDWIGLARSTSAEVHPDSAGSTTWRRCDLFSLPQVRDALEGADLAIYLVHSMLPTSRMLQGSSMDLDLLLADNFIRAAEEARVKRIIYLGGLIPADVPESELSKHLSGRLEVERILASRSIPITVLRAGLIFGPGGSSAGLLLNLVRRLPVMILPSWTMNQTQSIDIRDIVRAIDICLESEVFTGAFDLAGHSPMSYREMILRTSRLVKRKTYSVSFPTDSIRLSQFWVSLFGSTSSYLVNPLVESLRHNLRAKPNKLLDMISNDAISFDQSVKDSVTAEGLPLPHPRKEKRIMDRQYVHRAKLVRSIQRLPLPDSWPAHILTKIYAKWLRKFTFSLIREFHEPDGRLLLSMIKKEWLLLELTPSPYSIDCRYRRAYYITSGLLSGKVDPPGRFELRIFPGLGCLITAVHGYKPRLPWWLYSITQAQVHLAVMHAFGRALGRIQETLHRREKLKSKSP
jgi:nucleoside-diphosphate-sugar epimerase